MDRKITAWARDTISHILRLVGWGVLNGGGNGKVNI